jgi:hypothetical protein
MPAFVLFSVIATITSVNSEKYVHAIRQITLFTLAAVIMTIIQFVPYFLNKNGPSILLSAMLAQFQFSRIETFESHFIKETIAFYRFMYLSMGIMLILLFARLRKHRSDLTASIFLSGTLFCLVSVIGVEYSVKAHYYQHYSIMFVPYASVIFTYLCIFISGKQSRLLKVPVLAMLVGWYFLVAGTQLWNLRSAIFTPELSLSINDRNIDPALMGFLEKVISRGMSFYVPENANYHRLLNQGRIGDGHPSMLYFVLAGRRVGPIGRIFLYSDEVHEAPCLALWESHKDVIIVKVRQQVAQCLLGAASDYKEVSSDGVYRVFARRQSLEPVSDIFTGR